MRVPDFIRFGRAVCGDLDQAERREWWLSNGLGGIAGDHRFAIGPIRQRASEQEAVSGQRQLVDPVWRMRQFGDLRVGLIEQRGFTGEKSLERRVQIGICVVAQAGDDADPDAGT